LLLGMIWPLLVAFAPASYPDQVLSDQPIAYWRLDETSGTTLADTSGEGHDASTTGGLTLGATGAMPGDPDLAIGLDGQSAFARDDTPLTVGPDFTIEAWVKAASNTEDTPIVSVMGDGGSRTLYLHAGQFRGMDDVSSNWPTYSVTAGSSVDPTAWHHVAFVTQGGTNLTLYVDGLVTGSATIPSVAGFEGHAILGWSDDPGFARFAGSLDEVALYPTALSDERIKAHFAAGGGVVATCSGSLQALIDAAPAGSVLTVPPCLYRESIVIRKPLTLDGQGQAEIRGSDVWTNWNQNGATWVSSDTVPDLGADASGAQYTDKFRAQHLEQVFVDRTLLTQVPSNPGNGQFALDNGRHVILSTNPSGHTVEVTTRRNWETTAADNVTITNFTFQDAASGSLDHTIGNDNHANFALTNSTLANAHGTMLSVGGGDLHSSIQHNTLSGAGDLAIGSLNSGHALLQGNTISNSGYGGWDPEWQAGGIKTVGSNSLTVDGNTVYGNNGPGIWCDITCKDVTYSNNRVHNNSGPGMLFEISSSARIVSNAVWSNGGDWPGIEISNSAHAEVANNTVAWNGAGISVLSAQRSDDVAGGSVGNNVHDNTIAMAQSDRAALQFLQYGSGKMFDGDSNNRGSGNRYWYPDDEGGGVRFAWQQGFQKLSDFAGTPGGHDGSYLSKDQRDAALNGAGIPLSP
jgi:hypothetical protein